MDTSDGYDYAARFYRALLQGRKFVEPQVDVINLLIERSGLKHPRILDAACGTGDVLNALCERGFDAYGTDGSPKMLAFAREHTRLNGECRLLDACKWQALASLPMTSGFKSRLSGRLLDVILILGHALPHAAEQDMQDIFKQVHGCLNEGGFFAFDMRTWEQDATSGQLVEAGRTPKVRRWLGEAIVEGRKCWIDDVCKYVPGKQQIVYLIQYLDDKMPSAESFFLEYSIFDFDQVRRWFEKSPFKSPVEILSSKDTGWDYNVVIARK